MRRLTIRNVPDELCEQLRQEAAANRRILNNEVIVLLETTVGAQRRSPEEILQRARELMEKSKRTKVVEEDVRTI